MASISVVAPVFNESACIGEFHRRVSAAAAAITHDWELILVDDGSRDDSWPQIQRLAAQDSHVRGIRFSRNFGHHLSITAGLDAAAGDYVVVMDSDLQDPPEAIPLLHAEARRGFDHVIAVRGQRHDPWFKRVASRWFYRVFAWLTDASFEPQAGVFRIMSRRFLDVLRHMRETGRFFPGLADWVGFERSTVVVDHGARFAGETKYPLRKQFALALTTVLSFSDKPLLCVMYAGLVMSLLSVAYGCVLVVLALTGRIVVLGYASLASAIFFVGGFTIFSTGVVGIYVGRIFRQVQHRPLYVVAERVGSPAMNGVKYGDELTRHETTTLV